MPSPPATRPSLLFRRCTGYSRTRAPIHLTDCISSSARPPTLQSISYLVFFCCARYAGNIEDGRSAGRSPRWRLRRDIRPSMNFISRSCRAARRRHGTRCWIRRAQQPLRSCCGFGSGFVPGTLSAIRRTLHQVHETSPHLSPQFAAEHEAAWRPDVSGRFLHFHRGAKLDESSVRRTSVARIPGLSKPIRRNAKGPLRRYGTGLLFELLAVELVMRLPSLLFSLPRRLRAARPYLSFSSSLVLPPAARGWPGLLHLHSGSRH